MKRLSSDLVSQMYEDYSSGLSLAEVGRRHQRSSTALREIFERRGLAIRPSANLNKLRNAGGTFAPADPLSSEQIEELIATAKRVAVPAILKTEWRKWPMERRADFISRIRARLQSPRDRPETPFSDNVEPFDYASPHARAIADRLNYGLNSRQAVVKIDPCSQGVIWREQLWFWCSKVGYVRGPYTPEHGRPCLHHTIWADHHGRPVPPSHVVQFLDGNPNNLSPENLSLATRNDLCRRNQASTLAKRSRELTAILLNRNQRKTPSHGSTFSISQLRQRRSGVCAR